jgi:alkanesulfonate monooxygenase SsuD/methylene tetrahydromethanopterin reductase-like flavin-dependent oxidoreductase (luciferase family)
MTRTGLALPLNLLLPVAGQVDVAARAEALGYDTVWAAEAGTNDAFGLLTACAVATSRIHLATGVLPIFTRTPALMAQSAATLQDVSGGRFALGLGVSSETIVTRWNGVPYDRPLDRMREYVSVVRLLLAGEKVTRPSALYPVDGYRLLMHVPSPPAPVLVGVRRRAAELDRHRVGPGRTGAGGRRRGRRTAAQRGLRPRLRHVRRRRGARVGTARGHGVRHRAGVPARVRNPGLVGRLRGRDGAVGRG